MKISRLSVLTLGLFLVGCGLTDNMDKMKATTDDLANVTRDMHDTTNGLYGLTCSLYKANRQGVSEQTRRQVRNELLNPFHSIETRFRDAAVYFRSFEIQLWENQPKCDTDFRKSLITASAVEEFLIQLRGIIGGKRPDIDPLSMDPRLQTVFALSATLEQINDIQLEAGLIQGFTPVSMYSLILDGFAQLPLVESRGPEYVPEFVTKMLGYEDEAAYILDARYNIYPSIVADKMYDISQLSLTEKLKLLLKSSVVADLDKLNAAELRDLTIKYLYGAIDLRERAQTLGVHLHLHSNMAKLLKKAAIKDDPNAGEGKRRWTQKFKDALAELLCNSGCTSNAAVVAEARAYGLDPSWANKTTLAPEVDLRSVQNCLRKGLREGANSGSCADSLTRP